MRRRRTSTGSSSLGDVTVRMVAPAGLRVETMADDGTIRYDVEGHVARVTIDRPERRNALTWGLIADLRAAFARARGDAGVRVCVLTGAGDRAFCAGADLGGMAGE